MPSTSVTVDKHQNHRHGKTAVSLLPQGNRIKARFFLVEKNLKHKMGYFRDYNDDGGDSGRWKRFS